MWSSSESVILKQALVLRQPEAGNLVREIRQTQLTQKPTNQEHTERLGMTYSTLNRRKNDHMQSSLLASRQGCFRLALTQLFFY
jgi:hypothetical protein